MRGGRHLEIGILKPDNGEILFENKNIEKLNKKDYKSFRKSVQMVFQDPYTSLNPSKTIKDILQEPMVMHLLSHTWVVLYWCQLLLQMVR